jgi:hypothetical protein
MSTENVAVLQYSFSASDRYLSTPPGMLGSFQEGLQISNKLSAKFCCIWNTNPQLISSLAMNAMLNPMSGDNFDLAIPCYAEEKLGALINSSIIFPVVRALYGKRIHFPMAIDLCFSSRFVERLVQTDPQTQRPRSQQWIASEAIRSGMRVCQVNLPMDTPRPPESADVSSILSVVVGRLFQDLERNAAFWQKANISQNVAVFGEPAHKTEEPAVVDVQPMIENFQLGYRNLREIWSVAMPPGTFLEVKKLAGTTAADFRMPDDLWVRVVYDFALSFRQRAINREHLLRAMTPLYLAWVASYASESKDASLAESRLILDRLALAYEKQKPYLLSRWRWPDRFNP